MRRTAYVTAATIRRGKLRVGSPQRFIEALRTFADGAVLVSVKTATATRSTEANKLYWAGYVKPLVEYTGYDALAMHSYLKDRFLPHTALVIADAQGEIVDERLIARPTTTTLSPQEFSEYLLQVGTFAADLGVRVGSR